MQFRYDENSDAIYLRLVDRKIVESEEVRPGIVLDYDEEGNVVAIEVYRAASRTTTMHVDRALRELDGGEVSEMGKQLRAIRARIEAAGLADLDLDDIEREVARQRERDPRPLGERLRERREQIRAAGLPELSWDDIEREVAERRGGIDGRDSA